MSHATPLHKEPPKAYIIAAFAGLYIIWGSTYLAIFIAIQTIPTFFLVAIRFIIAGIILLSYSLIKGEKLPPAKSIFHIGIGGLFMLLIGNGALSWAEQYIPSGLSAIIVASVSLWFVVLDKRQWNYYFTNKLVVIGILVGFAGVFLLFSGKGSVNILGDPMQLIAFLVLIVGNISWVIGSLYFKYKKVEGSTTMKAALQMLIAGIVGLLVALLKQEHHHFSIADISLHSWMAVAYLVVMGSLVGYMSYIWLLGVRHPAIVGTYAYVNPIVAVLLGYIILGEAITLHQVFALIIILVGVLLVNFSSIKNRMRK